MIIWLASYPKSGNTWIRSFLASLLFNKNNKADLDGISNIPQYPLRSHFKNLVNNIGFDGSGHHIFKKEKFSFNQNNSLKKNKMNKLYYLETINFSFQKNFKMKLLSFLCFKYLHVNIINFLMKLKFSLNK